MSHTSSWRDDLDEDSDANPPEVQALLGGIRRPKGKSAGVDPALARGAFDSDENEEYAEVQRMGKLSLGTKLAFAFPNLAHSAMLIPTSIHINKFFADTLMVAPATLALATAIARAFDVMIDPFFGWLSDRTTTRWGRRKPYIFVGAPIVAICYYLLFTPPATLAPTQAAVWFGIFFSIYLIVPMSLPHHALGPELTQDYGERSSLYAWSEAFALFGVILAAAAPGIMTQYIPDQRVVFMYMAATIAFLLIFSYGLMLWFVKEPQQAVSDGNPLIPGLRRAWRNGPFRILVVTALVGAIAFNSSILMFPFYISYVVHPQNDAMWLSICLLVYFGCSAISIPGWCALAQVWDKKTVWLLGWAIYLPAGLLMFFLPTGAEWSLIILTGFIGFSFGGSSYLYKAIQADAIDYDELRTTQRREGQYITFWALIPKIVSIPAASLPLVVLAWAGYVPNLHPQPAEVNMTIRILTCLVPCFLTAVALVAASAYPIDRKTHETISAMIVRRRRAIREHKPVPQEIDPVTGGVLPQITGGLSMLTAEFCWYLDYFTEAELRLVLRRGQRALITKIWMWDLAFSVAIFVVGGLLIIVNSVAIRVIGISLLSISLAMFLINGLRLRAAYQFTKDKIRTFRKGKDEYFRVMTENQGEAEAEALLARSTLRGDTV